MAEPMTDARLAEIRGYLADDDHEYARYQRPLVVELLAEVDRTRALLAEIGEAREEWACTYRGGDLMRGFDDEADVRFTAHPGVTVYHRIVGEWRDDAGDRAYPVGG